MSTHNNFILSPITGIFDEVLTAISGISKGMESYSLRDYIMQSVFLKMTGFQEQKLKCICWEMATYDYEYRYKRFKTDTLGECSSYKEKCTVYSDIIQQIQKYDSGFKVSDYFNPKKLVSDIRTAIEKIFSGTNFEIWAQKDFNEFIYDKEFIPSDQLVINDSKLFENILQNRYKIVYSHRNRCAHNTLSYQQNLPTFDALAKEDYKYENYFFRFALLMLIDDIIVALYQKYLEVISVRI